MEVDSKLLGIRIMQKRKEKGFTQEFLSEKIGISKNHLSSIERGLYVPTTKCLLNICDVLGETPDYYLIGSIAPQDENETIKLLKKCQPNQIRLINKLIEVYINETKIIDENKNKC
ncbi:helix-turn-helix transcriptional regulator [uncultured Eubacterium sp.]|uniref:helix-turn-helix domain-containing protein n=1 Tax=uncultured Eubacterium sp. TaxID=165185 RepID=UPI0025F38237|nr:helix-turn-helix transcriptional regulator [uncultured Eubacterium sp.]